MNSDDAQLVAEMVAAKLPDIWLTRSPICSRAEAMKYARQNSDRSWRRFCFRNELTALPCGNYARDQVERAARRESRMKKAA